MAVKTGHIGIALAAQQDDLAMDIGLIFFGRKAAIIILPVAGRHSDILRQFEKIFTVAANRTGQTATGSTSWNFNFFLHQIKKNTAWVNFDGNQESQCTEKPTVPTDSTYYLPEIPVKARILALKSKYSEPVSEIRLASE